MKLRKTERNAIFETLVQAGFDPTEFDLQVIDDEEEETSLAHRRSSSEFVIGQRITEDLIEVHSVIGDSSRVTAFYADWRRALERWLEEVRKELDAPDLWSFVEQRQELFGGRAFQEAGNAPFDEDELAEIIRGLSEVREYARLVARLPEHEMRVLQVRLNYFADAATRHVGRFDWRNLVMGALVGDIISGVLPPEATRSVLTTLLQSVGHMLGHPLPGLSAG